jgi:hypothetical protein
MNKETIYYARFISPGAFFAEDWTKPLESPDPRKVEWPENAYAFSIHKREDVIDGDKRYEGKPEKVGPLYYHPESYIQTLDEVRTNPQASRILISNMECNKWAQIIWTRWNNRPQPFNADGVQILK